MDLTEYYLTESERRLKRLGVSHLWRIHPPQQKTPNPQPSSQGSIAHPAGESAPKPVLSALHRTLFHGKQFPAHSLWTYAELAADLIQANRPPRLELLYKIQESTCRLLHWESAKLVLWPCSEGQELFQHGVNASQPRVIFCFGKIHGTELAPSHASETLHYGKFPIQILPSLDDMINGNQESKNSAWKILQTHT